MTAAEHANTVRDALNTGPLPDSQSDRDKLDAGHDALDALQTQAETVEQFQSHEGMVTVYDDRGNYRGCMGIETWAWMLQRPQDEIISRWERAEAAEAERDRARDSLKLIPLKWQEVVRAALGDKP